MKRIILFSFLCATLLSCEKDEIITYDRVDFLGPWTCNEYEGDFAPQTYDIEVLPIGSENLVSITGLYNEGLSFVLQGEVQENRIYIFQQTVNGVSIGGNGTINESLDNVSISFTADDGSGADNVKANWIR